MKQIKVEQFVEEVRTSAAGKDYNTFVMYGSNTYDGEPYEKKIFPNEFELVSFFKKAMRVKEATGEDVVVGLHFANNKFKSLESAEFLFPSPEEADSILGNNSVPQAPVVVQGGGGDNGLAAAVALVHLKVTAGTLTRNMFRSDEAYVEEIKKAKELLDQVVVEG